MRKISELSGKELEAIITKSEALKIASEHIELGTPIAITKDEEFEDGVSYKVGAICEDGSGVVLIKPNYDQTYKKVKLYQYRGGKKTVECEVTRDDYFKIRKRKENTNRLNYMKDVLGFSDDKLNLVEKYLFYLEQIFEHGYGNDFLEEMVTAKTKGGNKLIEIVE